MPYYTIPEKVDNAIEAMINALRGNQLEGVTLYKGFSADEIAEPAVTIVAQTAMAMDGYEGIGVYNATVKIGVRSLKTAGVIEHSRMAGVLFDMFHTEDVCQQLTDAVPDLTVMLATCRESGARRIDGNAFVTEDTWEFMVAPSRPAEQEQ